MGMYGSIHTHFESRYDTANNLTEMCKNFIDQGAKRVAVTEHGVFSSYEDLRDIVDKLKAKYKEEHPENPNLDFEIIPGIEGYFEDNRSHLILIAKDYEGYLSLCKIISDSNLNVDSKGNPIITIKNLKENVKKGHVICTTACIAGPFGKLLSLEKYNLEDKIEKAKNDKDLIRFQELNNFVSKYEDIKNEQKTQRVTKTEEASIRKLFKKTGDDTLITEMEHRQKIAENLAQYLENDLENYNKANEELKGLRKKRCAVKLLHLQENEEKLAIINDKIANGDIITEAHALHEFFINTFGKQDFYYELQNHGLDQEKIVYNKIIDFAKEMDHPHFIASNDIHIGYTKNDDRYETMLKRRNVIKYTRFNTYQEESLDDKEYTIKTDEELQEELNKIIDDPEVIHTAISNIQNALEACSIEFPKEEKHYPKFCEDENAEFERLVRQGIKEKFPNGFPDEKKYTERLEYELRVIKEMGYAGYHLIVADYLQYGRLLGYLPTEEEIKNAPLTIKELDALLTEKKYPRIGYNIGPGRGSAVGSLCCYALGITDIDPIPYNLLFERFLNVERVSMPDIDSDFRTDIREKVIEYCKHKYGADCICQIMTKAYGDTKGNLRLAARYLGTKEFYELHQEEAKLLELEETDEVVENYVDNNSETIESDENVDVSTNEDKLPTNVKEYLKTSGWYDRADKLSKLYDELDGVLPNADELPENEQEIVTLAKQLEGVFTNYGQHAAGTIISGDTLTDIIPLMWNEKKDNLETQCTMAQAEAKGLLKMDFLGLNNLDIITKIIHPLKDNNLQDYVKRAEILKNSKIYEKIFSSGLTQGVFQFESDGMKKMLRDFKPESFEDIILLVAAYRPGPIDYIPEIVASKWFEKANGNYEEYSKTIKQIFPFSKDEYEQKKKKGLAYFYDEKGNVLRYVPHSITLKNETLEKILESTYGCPIYQEQIMQIFQQMAGYSLGGADIVRRYMSKKKEEPLKKEKHTFIYGDEERNIPGCMKLHGMTEQEAADLFEQMMPFAKYGFNKSHATAYAMVAMFTAYLKYEYPADFFRVSLDSTKELKEIPDFVKELPAFNLSIKGPSLLNWANNFTVETDKEKQYLRFGFKKIKGFSDTEINGSARTLEGFIELNPDISEKKIEKYARLGLFSGTWKNTEQQVRGNRHECLRWIKKNKPLYVKLTEQHQKIEMLQEQINDCHEKLKQITTGIETDYTQTEEFKFQMKEYSKLKRNLDNWTEKYHNTEAEITQNRLEDQNNRYQDKKAMKETVAERLENRAWEIDMLSIPFHLEPDRSIVKQSPNPNTFEDLKVQVDSDKVKISAIVLNAGKLKRTKKGTEYYEVSLMDKNNDIIIRRFDKPLNVLYGDFQLYNENHKYFICKTQDYSPINIQIKQPEIQSLSSLKGQEYVNTIQSVKQVTSNVSLANGRSKVFLGSGKTYVCGLSSVENGAYNKEDYIKHQAQKKQIQSNINSSDEQEIEDDYER